MDERTISLKLTSPDGSAQTVPCDSIRFSVPDGENGKNSGSVGIRRGHADALMAVAPGKIRAFSDGREIFSKQIGPGIAVVTASEVSVLTERMEE